MKDTKGMVQSLAACIEVYAFTLWQSHTSCFMFGAKGPSTLIVTFLFLGQGTWHQKLKEEMFIWVHGFSGFSLWLMAPRQKSNDRSAQHTTTVHLTVTRKPRENKWSLGIRMTLPGHVSHDHFQLGSRAHILTAYSAMNSLGLQSTTEYSNQESSIFQKPHL